MNKKRKINISWAITFAVAVALVVFGLVDGWVAGLIVLSTLRFTIEI